MLPSIGVNSMIKNCTIVKVIQIKKAVYVIPPLSYLNKQYCQSEPK